MDQLGSEIKKLIREKEWKEALNKNKQEALKPEDLRPLKVRLQEQLELKDLARKESFKSIITIDEQDAEHLKNVSKMKSLIEKKIHQENSEAIDEFRRRAVELNEEDMRKKLQQSLIVKQNGKSKDSTCVNRQKSLLLTGIKKKSCQ